MSTVLTGRALPQFADVVLRDGSTMRLRPPLTGDRDGLLAFFRRLSDRSLYLRFHGHPAIGVPTVEPMLEPDWHERGALVGTKGDRVVAVANYVRLRDVRTAEVAFAVADELQGRGIATRLLEQLAALAASVGIEEFLAEVMPDNTAMLRVFADAGFEASHETVLGTVEVHLSIAPTETFRARVDERDHVGVVSSLRPFFEPAAVAVIGASPRKGSIGGELFRNVLRGEFRGVCFPVNRSGASVAGVRAYRSIAEIGEAVDLAVLCLPGPTVLEAAEEALVSGVRAICVISAGFAEIGAEGESRQEQLVELVRGHGARLLGPNCLGIAAAGPQLNATFGPRALPPGNVGFSSQSGALGLAVLERAAERGLGLSAFVSVGNKADISSNDLLEYWEDDTVVVVGAGPIGLATVMTAKLYTPAQVIAIDLADSRLERAREFGADVTINNGREDAVAAVQELTEGLGADVAVEAVGVPQTFELCTALVRPGGRVANVGVHGHSATLHLETLWIKDVTITTGLVDTCTTPRLLQLIAGGRLDPTQFATHRFALGDTLDAYETFAAPAETNALKVVLEGEYAVRSPLLDVGAVPA